MSFTPGQRWVSTAEPELGLGVIVSADRRRVEISFPAQDSVRTYAAAAAPLRRIVFRPGDRIADDKGNDLTVTGTARGSADGLIVYQCGPRQLPESAIAATVAVSTPFQRLASGIADRTEDFDLRIEALRVHSAILGSPVRGFCGGRIELLPHQIYIANEVASRQSIRVLLADEAGLGKTIEACLIAHRLLLTGRAGRVLILVPESLVNQWFVELLRRFNLLFRLFTADHLASFGSNDNPFLADQAGICDIGLLAGDPAAVEKASAAGWDLVIVDEAHHLKVGSPGFECVRRLSEASRGLILLSATPEQLGKRDHFERLRLLDPHRYSDYATYLAEADRLSRLSSFVDAQLSAKNVDPHAVAPADIELDLPPWAVQNDVPERLTLLQLIDRLGTGRVIFRNTRRMITGFPKRLVHLEPLRAEPDIAPLSKDDPRIAFLAGLLAAEPDAKFLVICSTRELAIAIQTAVQQRVNVAIALFHEEMTLLVRDRNAAWFAEEEGARLLISSEIGSEGRNFQFCSRLVFFDLPADPELLEQRIGRLDRIGQGPEIHIYIPYFTGTPGETLCRWYHEGLDAFSHNVPAAGRVYENVEDELNALLAASGPIADYQERLNTLVARSRVLCDEISEQLTGGRDRLLELSSFQPQAAAKAVRSIEEAEGRHLAAHIMGRLYKHYGIVPEDAGPGREILLTDYVTDHRFPLPRQENPMITYDRKTALSRETIEFVSIDHPMVTGSLELFLSGDAGSCVYCIWNDPSAEQLLLESIYMLECIAPVGLYAGRFLPPTVIRTVVSHRGEDVSADMPEHVLRQVCATAPVSKLLSSRQLMELVQRMMQTSAGEVTKRARPIIEKATAGMRSLLDAEISRLQGLQKLNAAVRDEEIELLVGERDALERHLQESRLRLDAIRVIRRGNAGAGKSG